MHYAFLFTPKAAWLIFTPARVNSACNSLTANLRGMILSLSAM